MSVKCYVAILHGVDNMNKSKLTSDRIFKAAQTGNLSFFQSHINDNDFRNLLLSEHHSKSGDTVLHYAVRHNHSSLVEFLINEGLHPETGNFDGKTALHEGSQNESVDSVKHLLSLNVKINPLKRADWTPLMLACTKSNLEVVTLLLEAGAETSLKNKDGWNCFHIAVREGHLPIITTLLIWNKGLWNTVSNNGRTPLHTAALHGHVTVVKYLLDNCCYETDLKDSCGSTPLMDALRTENVKVAQILLRDHKADVTMTDSLGRSSIHLAAQTGALDSIRYLVEDCGVRAYTRCTGNDVTALHIAAKEGHSAAVLLLLSLGVDVNVTDDRGRTALHIAAGAQHVECVRTLLHNSANIKQDNTGTRPQQLARKSEIMQLFQQTGVT